MSIHHNCLSDIEQNMFSWMRSQEKPLLRSNVTVSYMRLKFATDHLDDSLNSWENALWMDETKIELFENMVEA